MFNFENKVALVTGGASGIGFAYAKGLLRNKSKAVALIDVNVSNGERAMNEIIKEFGKNRAIFVQADVSDKKQLEEAFEATIKAFNQLDIVINNAGIIQEIQWEKCISVNLVGVVTGCMLAMEKYLPKYKNGPEAVILNMASLSGLMPWEGCPACTATKFGVVGLTRSLGSKICYQNTKVRVIAVCPAVVRTFILKDKKNSIEETYLPAALRNLRNLPQQTPEELVKSAMSLIKEAPSGSVWLALDAQTCTEVKFPNYLV